MRSTNMEKSMKDFHIIFFLQHRKCPTNHELKITSGRICWPPYFEMRVRNRLQIFPILSSVQISRYWFPEIFFVDKNLDRGTLPWANLLYRPWNERFRFLAILFAQEREYFFWTSLGFHIILEWNIFFLHWMDSINLADWNYWLQNTSKFALNNARILDLCQFFFAHFSRIFCQKSVFSLIF